MGEKSEKLTIAFGAPCRLRCRHKPAIICDGISDEDHALDSLSGEIIHARLLSQLAEIA